MIQENRTVMVKLLQQPSHRRANGGATDHDDPGTRSVEGGPSGIAWEAHVAPSRGPTRALGPADRTTVCAGARRGAQGDHPSFARPRLEPSAASRTAGQGPGVGEDALPGLWPDLRHREVARAPSPRPLPLDPAPGHDRRGPVASTPPEAAASRLAAPPGLCRRAGAARWLRPRLVRGARSPMRPVALHRRCDEPAAAWGVRHRGGHADPLAHDHDLSPAVWPTRGLLRRQGLDLPRQSPGDDRGAAPRRRPADAVHPRDDRAGDHGDPGEQSPGEGAGGALLRHPSGSPRQGAAAGQDPRSGDRHALPAGALLSGPQSALRSGACEPDRRPSAAPGHARPRRDPVGADDADDRARLHAALPEPVLPALARAAGAPATWRHGPDRTAPGWDDAPAGQGPLPGLSPDCEGTGTSALGGRDHAESGSAPPSPLPPAPAPPPPDP